MNEKPNQRRPSHKKSRCSWDGLYLRASITVQASPSDKQCLYVESAVNRQPVFRRKLEQIIVKKIFSNSSSWGTLQIRTSSSGIFSREFPWKLRKFIILSRIYTTHTVVVKKSSAKHEGYQKHKRTENILVRDYPSARKISILQVTSRSPSSTQR